MLKIKATLRYVITIHVSALTILTLLRVILLVTNLNFLKDTSYETSWIGSALLRGVWFDNVIACYISVAPLVILSIFACFNVLNKTLIRIFNSFYIILFGLIFAVSAADIPYFSYFFKHLNASIFNWKEEGGNATQMILQESSYYIYFAVFILLLLAFIFIVIRSGRRAFKQKFNKPTVKQYSIYISICLLLIGGCILGIRGRVGRNPIKTSQAYFSNHSFLNQLGLNPTFFLMRSIIENSKKHISIDKLIEEETAIIYVQEQFQIPVGQTKPSPIFRQMNGSAENKDVNIVFILMESMSADLLSLKNGKFTPYLNELKNESYYFNNFYSAGTHTNHGVAATLFGLPSLFDKNMMKDVEIPLCQGIPEILKNRGYETLFFVTHESQYDNMNAFLLENGIERMYAQEDYPSSKVANGFGVQDDYLFEFAANKLTEYSKKDKPFFATILTISNHPPYIVPEKFKSVSKDPQEQIVAFADDAIRQFMTDAKKQSWYNNTIFVFLGDHGKIVGTPMYDMPLSYNHIPLIIHSPLFSDAPKVYENLGGQIDVFPTILGRLDYSYNNNTMGIDILKNERPYMYFTSDDMMGCVSKEFFYTYNPVQNTSGLFKYKQDSTTNELDEYKALADSMQNYAVSMLLTTDYLLKNKLTRVED